MKRPADTNVPLEGPYLGQAARVVPRDIFCFVASHLEPIERRMLILAHGTRAKRLSMERDLARSKSFSVHCAVNAYIDLFRWAAFEHGAVGYPGGIARCKLEGHPPGIALELIQLHMHCGQYDLRAVLCYDQCDQLVKEMLNRNMMSISPDTCFLILRKCSPSVFRLAMRKGVFPSGNFNTLVICRRWIAVKNNDDAESQCALLSQEMRRLNAPHHEHLAGRI